MGQNLRLWPLHGYSNKWRLRKIILYANEIVYDFIKKDNAGLGSPITQIR